MAFKGFDGLVRDPRDVPAPEGSTNAELLALPQQRVHTHDMKGRLVLLPRTGIIGVAYRESGSHNWSFVVVNGDACKKEDGPISYPRGGYDIDVSDLEMQTAIEFEFIEEYFARVWSKTGGSYDFPARNQAAAEAVVKLNVDQGHRGHAGRQVSFTATAIPQ